MYETTNKTADMYRARLSGSARCHNNALLC